MISLTKIFLHLPNSRSMKKLLFFLLFSVSGSLIFSQNGSTDARLDYIKQYSKLAVEEMERTGIPASIKLAQAILESNAGQSTLAIEANNHFGIKCGGNWDGKTYYSEDDDRDAAGNTVKSCFRKYKKPETGYEDHSEFLRDPKKYNRYGFLFKLNPQDYRSWAYGLQSAGYATNQAYAESLIRVIETYKLSEYDKGAGGEIPPPIANRRSIGRVNDVKVVLAKEAETLDDVARIYRLRAEKLMEYNDNGYARSDKLKGNTRVFIQKKQKRWRGRSKFHFVRDNQSMFEISQLYGIRQESLMSGNKMESGEEPANGAEVRIRGFFWKKGPKPALRAYDPTKTETQPIEIKPTPPVNSEMTPDDEVPFEIGDGTVGDPNKTPTKPTPGTPSTSGAKIPVETPAVDPSKTTDNRPTSDIVTPGNLPKPKPTQPANGVFHTVQKGDNLYNISKKYGTTVANLKQLNNLQTDNVNLGQQLLVQQQQAVQPTQPATGVFHTVQKGDNLLNISKKYGTTVAKLKQLNNLPADNIQLGQQLRVQ